MKKQKLISNLYERQSTDNWQDFLGCSDFEDRRNIFFKFIKEFEEQKVEWALGCSSNLFFRGIVDDFNDFDIIVDKSSITRVTQILENFGGELVETGSNECCQSDCYFHYVIGRCDIDVISGFRLKTFGTSYYYPYQGNQVELLDLDYVTVPLLPAEALFVLYDMMEGWQRRRRFKRELIFQYLKENSGQPDILKSAKESYLLPGWLNSLIEELLN